MKSTRLILTIIALPGCLFGLTGCLSWNSSPTPALTQEISLQPTETRVIPPTSTAASLSQHRCGDGICDGPEDPNRCPADCPAGTLSPKPEAPTQPAASSPAADASVRPGSENGSYWVVNPSSGAELYVQLSYPRGWNGERLPTLVLVPGGTSVTEPQHAERLAQAGFTVVRFDPDGRGRSQGQEDLGGFIQQDGLAEIIRAATGMPGVDANKIAIISYSYGVTMATGALARYPDLPVRFLIDWEGPADRYDTTSDCSGNTRHIWPDCNDDAAWAQREALTFVAQLRIPYQRVQSSTDHVQPDVSHAINMINAAIQGGVPWTRLNLEAPNQRYDPQNPPAMLPDEQDRLLDQLLARLAQELFDLFC